MIAVFFNENGKRFIKRNIALLEAQSFIGIAKQWTIYNDDGTVHESYGFDFNIQKTEEPNKLNIKMKTKLENK